MARVQRPRGTRTYTKPALSTTDMVVLLRQRGLTLVDETRCRRYLSHLGYFRLSPYTIPLQTGDGDHRFRPGTTFDDVLDLYVFDRQLRLLVLDALERIEVAVRAAVTDHLSVTYVDPHWYEDSSHFRDPSAHSRLLHIVRGRVDDQRSRAPDRDERSSLTHPSALEHYVTMYGTPELPPSWLMVEELTLGQLESLYRNLRRREDRTSIARAVGLNDPLLTSWLRVYVRVRNICAHHGRLWNVGLGVYPKLPASDAVRWLSRPEPIRSSEVLRRRLYPVLASLQTVLFTISPHSSWARRLDSLLEEHPRVPLAGMGIPADWRTDDFWRSATTA